MCITLMNIVFASDKNYVEHLAVSMCSLFENNQEASFDVYILNVDIDSSSWSGLEVIARRYGHTLTDVKILDQELDGLVLTHHFTKANYYRLFIAEKLQLTKALYLDADIVVSQSILDLYNTDIDSYSLAAVVNPGFNRHKDLEMPEESKYFNSGVMLINLDAWRLDKTKGRVIDLVKRKPWAIQFVDQCGLNSVLTGRWKELHPKFNLQGCFFEAEPGAYSTEFPDGYLMDAVRNPVVIHYSGSHKPWHLGDKHPYRSLYWKYLRMTPFNHFFSNDFTALKVISLCTPRVVKKMIRLSLHQKGIG